MRLLFWLALLLLVIFRFVSTRPTYQDGQRFRISAKVLQEPTKYGTRQKVSLAGLKIFLPAVPEINYGDDVVVEGVVNGKELSGAALIKISPSQGILYKLKNLLVGFYQKSLPQPHASLIAGIVLGSKGNLPSDFWQGLKNSGVAHVVVASGMNVSFVAGFLLSVLLLFFPRKKAVIVTIITIWIYALIACLEAPIVRAAIMASFTFLGQSLGRLVSAFRILIITALAMLVVRPEWIGDLGFILTFVSTASLLLFQAKINRLVKPLRLPRFFNEGLTTSLAAQIGVAPILYVTFGQFNLLSPFINALVLWTVPYIMILGSIGALIGLVFPFLGRMVLFLAYPLTWWFVTIVSVFNL